MQANPNSSTQTDVEAVARAVADLIRRSEFAAAHDYLEPLACPEVSLRTSG